MNIVPVGGRGHKVPYSSRTVRVPEPILDKVDEICTAYRQAVMEGNYDNVEDEELINSVILDCQLTKEQAINEAEKILKGRRNARISLEKLLRVLYNDKQIKL